MRPDGDYSDPRAYWAARAQAQGPSYVGPGGRPERSASEAGAFGRVIGRVLGERRFRHVLDFGCGSGRMAPPLADFAEQYTGVDITVPALEHCPALPNARYLWLAGETLPDDVEDVDLIVATVVFQHIPPGAFEAWTAELRRVMTADACALVIDAEAITDPYPHMHPRTPDEIADALGLKVRTVGTVTRHWWAWMT